MPARHEKFGFAPHLMLDGYECAPQKLADPDFIFETLDKLIPRLKLDKLLPPSVFSCHDKNGGVGVSGVVLAADAHITLHTFSDKRHLFVDIFSTRDFNAEEAAEYLAKIFEAGRHETQILSRGIVEGTNAGPAF